MIRLVEDLNDVALLFAAGVLVVGTKRAVERHLNFWLLLVDMAVAHFRDVVKHIAPITFENVQVGPDLPVNFSPRYSVCLSHKSDELLQVPGSVNTMFRTYLAVTVNV